MPRPSERLAGARRLAMKATSTASGEATAIDVRELAEAEVAEVVQIFAAAGWSSEVTDGELQASPPGKRPPAPEHWIVAAARRCSTLEEAAASTGISVADLEAWLERHDLAAADILRR